MYRFDFGFLIIFGFFILVTIIIMYVTNIQTKKYDKLLYFTELSCAEIVSRMSLQNIKDNIKFKCVIDDIERYKFIFSCTDIIDDWHYKPGYIVYEMYLEPREHGTFIFLFLIERSSLTAQLRYSDVMNKFMKNKLLAQFWQTGWKN